MRRAGDGGGSNMRREVQSSGGQEREGEEGQVMLICKIR